MTQKTEVAEYIKSLENCCLQGMPSNYQVLEVAHFIESERDGDPGVVVCRISYSAGKKERWAVVIDNQDYTGHG